MKKFVIIFLSFIAASVVASAQMPQRMDPSDSLAFTRHAATGGQDIMFRRNTVALDQLLSQENEQLSQRTIAMILSLSGGAVTAVGAAQMDEYGYLTPTGKAFAAVGLITASVGEVWLIVNEFQLISTRKKINHYTQLRLTPNCLKYSF